MVNAELNSDRVEMGVLAVRNHENNGSFSSSLLPKQVDMRGKVYKLSIQIDKIRPKPCPKSKKSAFLAEARKLEQIRAGIFVAGSDQASIVPKKPVICSICNETYQSAQSLYLHKKKHHRHVCTTCETTCQTESACENHEKLHASDDPALPYKCHLCAEKFDAKRHVRLHVRVLHSEVGEEIEKKEPIATKDLPEKLSHVKQIAPPAERVSELDYNEKIEGTLKKVQEREAVSYGDVTFTCRVCCKDFATVEAAEAHTKDHMEIVDEEHKCTICKKLFKDETSLNEHLAEHLARALRCPVCPKAFINRATLRIHMKSHGQG